MKPENKELLLKDLCARLPYDIIVKDEYGDYIEVNIYTANLEHLIDRVSEGIVKMVLRPMSSMTEEETKEYQSLCEIHFDNTADGDFITYYFDTVESFDWLNKNMFDYRGLIPKDLALSTEMSNPYKD